MKSIRNLAALSLFASSLCMAATASAQPGNLVAKDSFNLTRVAGPNVPVDVLLVDDPGPALWKVVAGSDENAAKLSWNVDARCGVRLKSLSVKHADGTKNFQSDLTPSSKGLQKEVVFPTFKAQTIKQICLDIANGTLVSAGGDPVQINDLKKLQDQFNKSQTQSAVAWVNGELLLSGQCTNAAGTSSVTTVTDKKFPAQMQINCMVQ